MRKISDKERDTILGLMGDLSMENRFKVINYARKLNENQLREEGLYNKQETKNPKKDYRYLNIFKPETKAFIIKIIEDYGFNLYHSVTGVINGSDKPLEEHINNYMKNKKNKEKDYVRDNPEIIREIFETVYESFKERGKLKYDK